MPRFTPPPTGSHAVIPVPRKPTPMLADLKFDEPNEGGDDFFNVTDDDEAETAIFERDEQNDEIEEFEELDDDAFDDVRVEARTPVRLEPSVRAPLPTAPAPEAAPPRASTSDDQMLIVDEPQSGLADLLEPGAEAEATTSATSATSTSATEPSATRPEQSATTVVPSPAANAPRRRGSAGVFLGGLGLGVAVGVAVMLVMGPSVQSPFGGGEPPVAAASMVAAPTCPDPEVDGGEVAAPGSPDDVVLAAAAIDPPAPNALDDEEEPDDDEAETADAETDGTPAAELAPAPEAETDDAAEAGPSPDGESADGLGPARAQLESNPAKAYEMASAYNDTTPSNEAVAVMTTAMCKLGDGPGARKAFRQLKFKEPRRFVSDACVEMGIQIFAKTLDMTPKEKLAKASDLYGKGDRAGAEKLALESYKEKRRAEALVLVGMIACDEHDEKKANRYAKVMTGESLEQLTAHCTSKNVTLTK